MKKLTLALALATAAFTAYAQPAGQKISYDYPEIGYYLPQDAGSFDAKVPDPMQALGFNFAERFVEWSDVVSYMETLARTSDRVSIKYFGKSFEKRPFVQICITSPENRKRLEEIRTAHLALDGTGPLVVNLMGSIHGNEISGVTGLLPVAYYYAASTSPEVEKMLNDAVIVITPGQNPDGINRFANWVNNFTGLNHWVDRAALEYNQVSPRSRCNHWWMDCNRDWLACQFEVGQECVKMYREWMPNVVLDLHEQSSKGSYYFSPGDPNRTHKYIPQANQDLTLAISKYTGKALKSIGTKYFSGRNYDDFFIGKGAAYCDVQGSVGILHEQSSTRGHVDDFGKGYGVTTFQQTVRNQSYSAYAVTKGALDLSAELLKYQKEFFENAADAAQKDKAKAWVFNTRGDHGMAYQFVSNLLGHGIEVYRDGKRDDGFIVPLGQKNYYLVKCIFEDITEYSDSLFYDISTWSHARAFNLDAGTVNRLPALGDRVEKAEFRAGEVKGAGDGTHWCFGLDEFYAPYMISALQHKGIKLNVSSDGLLSASLQEQTVSGEELAAEFSRLSGLCGVDVTVRKALPGESSPVRSPKVGILTKEQKYAGELWYLLDYRQSIECSVVNDGSKYFNYSNYDVLFTASSVTPGKKLKKWVEDGGTLFLQGNACSMVSSFSDGELEESKGLAMGRKGVRGIVLNASFGKKDSPLLWGYSQKELPLFKQNANVWTAVPEEGVTVMSWPKGGYLSGCVSEANLRRIEGTPTLFYVRYGKGVVICSQCDLAYRSYWLGTSRILTNAIFFADKLR